MSEQAIIEFLRNNGPSIPSKLAKHLGTSLLFASAMLAEVASKGIVKISNLKIGGGSPLYYLKDQEEQLQNFSSHLNSKDRQAYELLKEKNVLRDKDQTPLVRVSLRIIKDFATPVYAVVKGEREIFWKWHLLNERDAEEHIKKKLGIKEKKPENKKLNQANDIKPKEIKSKEASLQTPNFLQKPAVNPEIEESNKEKTLDLFGAGVDLNADFSVKHANNFGKRIIRYLDGKGIKIVNYEQIKKNKEFNMMLNITSAVGKSKYYCKAVDKKKINEGDLALAIVEAQNKNLPSLYLTTGEVAKKVQEKMNTIFKDLNFVRI